jgi:multiple sugar transport system substrate-binding protein
MIELRGITWDHPRGYAPLRAASALYRQQHPGVELSWDIRTLQEFADYPIERLADRFDLLIIDHPFVGFAAASGCLAPLDEWIDAATLAALARQSVGQSHASYTYAGRQWALAVDAAGQVSAWRPDLLERLGRAVPQTWDDVLALGHALRVRGLGAIALPSIPIDALMSFCSLCANAGEDPFAGGEEQVVSHITARWALELLRELVALGHPESLGWNPIRALDRMSQTDEVAYVPLLFGYSNYAREGFRPQRVRFGGIPAAGPRGGGGAILGGTGLAVSARCAHRAEAAAFAAWVCGAEVQASVYVGEDGQPGNRVAWQDPAANLRCNGFFADTLPTLQAAYLRPRYNGFMEFQDQAGAAIHGFLRDGGSTDALIHTLDRIYRDTRVRAGSA